MAQYKVVKEADLQKIVDQTLKNKKVFGLVLTVGSDQINWAGSAGNISKEDPYFIASATKLYTTAIILKLRELKKLELEDKIANYLPPEIIKGLHVFRGKDFSDSLTIRHLLAQTSGLPDYFQQKKENNLSILDELVSGKDQYWSFEKAIELSKKIQPKFPPGEKGKAYYSDTNFQLLGKIIEAITGIGYEVALNKFIIHPLDLRNTYLFTDMKDEKPKTMYFNCNLLPIPLAMTATGADGGIVSTSEESLIFLKAFFNGELFSSAYLEELKSWNKIFFPLEYGIGISRFKLPRIFSPFKPFPELIGHSGLSGAFAYYSPEKRVFLAGTVNQISNPEISYKLMLKIVNLF